MFFLSLIFVNFFEAKNHNFLLITIDTWRADYISISGFKKVQTPNLDKIAQQGIYLKFMETPVPMTAPAHASILTGLYPKNHGLRDNRYFKLKSDVVTLAQLFKEKNYKTIAIISGVSLLKRYGLDKGFDVYDDENIDSPINPHIGGTQKLKRAETVLKIARKYIKEEKGSLFLWLHFYDPHDPYNPPKKFRDLYPNDPYAGEVAYVDEVIGDLFKEIVNSQDRWTLIIVGDHGEDLYDHGEATHGILLYNTTRKVPFILWDNQKKFQQIGNSFKSLIDIFPTLLEIFNLRKISCDGLSLFKDVERKLFFETYMPLGFGINQGVGVRFSNYSYIRHGTSQELYEDNFIEDKNLASIKKDIVNKCESDLKSFYSGEVLQTNLKLTEEESKVLGSLGYLGSISPNFEKIAKCDLRDFARDYSYYFEKIVENERDKDKDLSLHIKVVEQLLKKYPNSGIFHCDRAVLLFKLQKYDEAYKECEACSMLDKENPTAYKILGDILALKGKFEEAEKKYQISLKFNPSNPLVHLSLGMIYYEKLKVKDKALYHLKKYLELDPNSPRSGKVKDIINTLSKKRD